ncbi:MAG: GldG family protein, partial [Bacteroidales bacterium]|nr:GldG family protein [Bacteroidales bacterium]
DGRKGFIRYFNEMMASPGDRESTAAFKRMILDKFPKVAFLSGTGRVITQGGDMNYSNFTDKLNRTSLYNQGFDVTSVDLKTPIEEDVNIMVIADMNFSMTPEQKANYQQYIDRGGNLFILGEPINYTYTNAIVEQFGVKALAGRIVQGQDGNRPDLIFGRPTDATETTSYILDVLRQRRYLKVAMPSVSQLAFEEGKGYDVKPLFTTAPDRLVWNEVESTNFEEARPKPNPVKGEIEDSLLTTMVVLKRPIDNNREQKIIISGDADCISNVELSNRAHSSESLGNSEIVLGAFNFLSDGISPIDVRRPEAIDTTMSIKSLGARCTKRFFNWFLPGMMLLSAVLIYVRRRSR